MTQMQTHMQNMMCICCSFQHYIFFRVLKIMIGEMVPPSSRVYPQVLVPTLQDTFLACTDGGIAHNDAGYIARDLLEKC